MSRVCAAIAVAVSLHCVCAQAAPLSLEEALSRAERESPLVRRARTELQVVAAARAGAGVLLPYNPAVGAAVGGRRDNSGSMPPADGLEWALRLEQTVEIAGQRGARLKEADAGIKVAAARVRVARVETLARVRAAYVGALIAQAAADSARRREELGRRLVESAQARVRAGAASDVDLHLAEVERGRLTAERIEAELMVGDALVELKRAAGLDARGEITLSTPLGMPAVRDATSEQLFLLASKQRADLQALVARHGELDAAIVRLKREAVPSPTLFADVAMQQPGQLYGGGGIAIPLPLWQRNQGPLAIARAQKDATDVEQELLSRDVALEVDRALRTSRARREEAQLWLDVVVPAAEANLGLIEQGWRSGKFDLFRVIQASREAGDARRTQLERLGALWHAVIELDRATGTP